MVSTRRSSKRQSIHEGALATSSKKPCRRKLRKPKPTLVTLPAEVRQLILKEILWQQEPVEFTISLQYMLESGTEDHYEELLKRATSPCRSLYPHILSTCKLLYSEGRDVLYSNVVNCRIGRPFFDANFYSETSGPVVLSTRFAGRGGDYFDVYSLPTAVLTKMSRCRVQVFVHHDKRFRANSLRRQKARMETLAHALKETNWYHLEIQIIHMYGESMEYHVRKPHHARRFLEILAPLRYVRHRKTALITGMPSHKTSFLTDIIKSPMAVDDVESLFTCLKRYKDHIIGGDSFMFQSDQTEQIAERIEHVFKKCIVARDVEDMRVFIRRRERVMFLIGKYVLAAQQEVFNIDPLGILMYLALSQDHTYPHRNPYDPWTNEDDSENEHGGRRFDDGDWSEESDG